MYQEELEITCKYLKSVNNIVMSISNLGPDFLLTVGEVTTDTLAVSGDSTFGGQAEFLGTVEGIALNDGDIDDVSVVAVQDSDVLKWDNLQQKWVNTPGATIANTIYTTDDSLTGDRNVDMGSNDLNFNNGKMFNVNTMLPSLRVQKIESSDDLQSVGIEGIGFQSINPAGNIRSALFSGDSTIVGGFPNQCAVAVQELPQSPTSKQAVINCLEDGSNNYSILMVASDGGANTCITTISDSGDVTHDVSGKTNFNSGDVQLTPLITGQDQGLAIDSTGIIQTMPYVEEMTYVPTFSNFVGCSGVTDIKSFGTRIGNTVNFSVNCLVAVTVGSGSTVSFRVTVPPGWEPDNDWTISNVGETSGIGCKTNFFTAAGSNVIQFFGNTTSKAYGVTFFSNAITGMTIKCMGTYRIDN